MTRETITEFYIGLSGKDMTEKSFEAVDVIESLSGMVEGGTFKEGKGLWMGELEESLIFEVADLSGSLSESFVQAFSDELEEQEAFEVVKDRLEEEFDQDSVMVKKVRADVHF